MQRKTSRCSTNNEPELENTRKDRKKEDQTKTTCWSTMKQELEPDANKAMGYKETIFRLVIPAYKNYTLILRGVTG